MKLRLARKIAKTGFTSRFVRKQRWDTVSRSSKRMVKSLLRYIRRGFPLS